jgi:hypothetical protein
VWAAAKNRSRFNASAVDFLMVGLTLDNPWNGKAATMDKPSAFAVEFGGRTALAVTLRATGS